MVTLVWVVGAVLVLQVPPPDSAASPANGSAARRRGDPRAGDGTARGAGRALASPGRRPPWPRVLARVEPRPTGRRRDRGSSRCQRSSPPRPSAWPTSPPGGRSLLPGGQSFRRSARPPRRALRSGRASRRRPPRSITRWPTNASGPSSTASPTTPRRAGCSATSPTTAAGPPRSPPANSTARMVDHPTFGWVDATWVPHLERGELPAPPVAGQRQVRWLPAAQADALHRDWDSALEDRDRALPDPDQRPALRGDRLRPAARGVPRPLLRPARRRDRADDACPLAHRYPRTRRWSASGQPTRTWSTTSPTKQEYVDFLEPTEGPGSTRAWGSTSPPSRPAGSGPRPTSSATPRGRSHATATLFHEVSHQLLFEPAGRQRLSTGTWATTGSSRGSGTYFETVVVRARRHARVGGLVGPRIDVAQTPPDRTAGVRADRAARPARSQIEFNRRRARPPALCRGHGADRLPDARRTTSRIARRSSTTSRTPTAAGCRRDTGRSLDDRLGVPYKTLDAQFLDVLAHGVMPPLGVGRPDPSRGPSTASRTSRGLTRPRRGSAP